MNRNGNGAGFFFHTRTRPAGLPWKPGPSPFIIRIFFLNPKPTPSGPLQALSPHAQPSPKSETQILIYDFSAQNHKHKHKDKHRNHKQKFQIYDFPCQNHKPTTNFRSMIFPFKITNINTNTNSHDSDELNSEKKKEEKKWRMRWSKRGCETLGEEDQRGRGLCDSVRSVTTRTKWS